MNGVFILPSFFASPSFKQDSFSVLLPRSSSHDSVQTLVEPLTPSTLCSERFSSDPYFGSPPTSSEPNYEGRTVRRLPQPPKSAPCSPITKQNLRPLPAVPQVQSSPNSAPLPTRTTLSLQTDVVQHPTDDPITPYSPIPPSPTTTLNKRSNKLRRHFGERPPSILLHGKSHASSLEKVSPPPTSTRYSPSSQSIKLSPSQAAEISRLLSQFDHHENSGSSDTDSEASGAEDEGDFHISVVQGVAYRTSHIRRISRKWSRKWTREKGGRTWEPDDYDEVVKALREL